MNKLHSNPATFEQERSQRPGHKAVSTLHRPKKISNFCRKKFDKKAPALLCIVLGVVTCKNHVTKPLDSFNKCREIILQCRETFFCRNLKNDRMSNLGQLNVETALCLVLQGLSCSKVAGYEDGLFIKFSRATFFVFISTHMVDVYLSFYISSYSFLIQ